MNRIDHANHIVRAAATVVLLTFGLATAHAASDEPATNSRERAVAAMRALPWESGPATSAVGARSSVKIPKDVSFLKESDGSKFLELSGNLPSPGSSIIMAADWWAVLDFSDLGYVKDDEKIDADALLKSIKESDEPANEERRKRGLSEIRTEGWFVPPHYDAETRYLEWGLKLRSATSAEPVINYSVRLLGRSGVENVVLVSSPETLTADVAQLKTILKSFEFNRGEKYTEFKPGDHVAEIGLGALVLGGAAAVAAKTGFWKVLLAGLAAFWKVIAVAAVAIFGTVGKLFKRKPAR